VCYFVYESMCGWNDTASHDGPYAKHTAFTSESDMLETARPIVITRYHNYLTQPLSHLVLQSIANLYGPKYN
jgi:hypothetical protein